jgi:hypothetical protein
MIMSAKATLQVAVSEASASSVEARPTYEDIASLAYALWQQRGCPEGSSEEDWFKAEQELSGPSKT